MGGSGAGGASASSYGNNRQGGSTATAKEEEDRGREALMRLGIFLEKHETQEDTVDVLSSMGWL